MKKYFKEYLESVEREFPGFKIEPEVAEFIKKEKFEDTSYHNDEMPQFTKSIGGQELIFWLTDGSDYWDEYKKYCLVARTEYLDRDIPDDEKVIIDTNDFKEFVKAYNNYIK